MNRIVLEARLIVLGTGGLPKTLSDWPEERVIREQAVVRLRRCRFSVGARG